jgi:hypothetical protein
MDPFGADPVQSVFAAVVAVGAGGRLFTVMVTMFEGNCPVPQVLLNILRKCLVSVNAPGWYVAEVAPSMFAKSASLVPVVDICHLYRSPDTYPPLAGFMEMSSLGVPP